MHKSEKGDNSVLQDGFGLVYFRVSAHLNSVSTKVV